jgi:predicted nucleic acid-binding protein
LTSTVVVDANLVMHLITAPEGFDVVADADLIAPPLLWSEVRSVLHVALGRGLLERPDAQEALEIFESSLIRERKHPRLGAEVWRIADELGWMKTYDAEYLAIASLVGAPIATLDRRMARAAERLGIGTHQLP